MEDIEEYQEEIQDYLDWREYINGGHRTNSRGSNVGSLFIILGVSELLLSMQQGVVPLPPGSTPSMCHTATGVYVPIKDTRHTMKFYQIYEAS